MFTGPRSRRLTTGLAACLAGVLACLVLLTACQTEKEHSAELFVFGTIVEVKVWGASQEQSGKAFSEIQQMFQGMHRDWHAWEPGLLVQINEAFASGDGVTANPEIAEMIRQSQWVEEKSGGLFNPAIGGLVALWGFHTSDYPIIGPPPSQADIDKILAQQPSSLDIRINAVQLTSDNPFVQLDFGGIAKGYAVDLAVARLRELGIGNAIVNAGGDLRAFGRHGDRPWRVAVRKPGGGTIGTVEVRGDEALFTSGNYERFREDAEERYPHILDPRTGWPVRDVASATVITGTGTLADAAATALIVAGMNDWTTVARALGLSQVLMIDDAGRVYLTPEMANRIQFDAGVDRVVVDRAPAP
ncbi:MAG: FAD:protein FMN transferase [Xanthomonadales bacterium]|nr:FAD:protein FMN transferase [Xanthomonadales bacterium]